MIALIICLLHVISPRSSNCEKGEEICRLMRTAINQQDKDTIYEYLHVILKIPPPIHAHSFPIINKIINKEERSP